MPANPVPLRSRFRPRETVTEIVQQLLDQGIKAAEVGADGLARADGVHVGTMHRFKGLEYQRIIIAGLSDGIVPCTQERARERSRVFVAATRLGATSQ